MYRLLRSQAHTPRKSVRHNFRHAARTLSHVQQQHLNRHTIRNMSSAAAVRHKFIVYAPDMTDEGAFQRRLSVRASHLERAGQKIKEGVVSACRASFSES